MVLYWPCSVNRFSICRFSVRHFPERSWTVVAFPCFTLVKSFTSWYAVLLLFFLRCCSISLHSAATITNRLASFRSGAAQRVVNRHLDIAFRVNLIHLTITPKRCQCQSQARITADAALTVTPSETQGPTRFHQRAFLVRLLL